MKAFYFGCVREPGHHFFGPDGEYRHFKEFAQSPWRAYELDAQLAPHFEDCIRKRSRFCKYCDCASGPEGIALLHHKAGWTALSFWDRSVDNRGASNSTFILEGDYDFNQALALARSLFPSIFARFTFEVREFSETRS